MLHRRHRPLIDDSDCDAGPVEPTRQGAADRAGAHHADLGRDVRGHGRSPLQPPTPENALPAGTLPPVDPAGTVPTVAFSAAVFPAEAFQFEAGGGGPAAGFHRPDRFNASATSFGM